MELKDFKKVENISRKDMCYSYIYKKSDFKYTIFTSDGGKKFLATIEQKRLDGRYYLVLGLNFSSTQESINHFNSFLQLKETEKTINAQRDIDPEYSQIVNDNFWEIL